MINVLFVCMGNICRSPMAEGIFQKLVEIHHLKDKISHDSAGTENYHSGHAPDRRMQQTAQQYGLDISQFKARQIQVSDMEIFDYILVMDTHNHSRVNAIRKQTPRPKAEVFFMRDFEPDALLKGNVPDPYYGGDKGFQDVYQILERTVQHFFDFVCQKHGLRE